MTLLNLKRVLFWLIGFSPTLWMLALLPELVTEEISISPGPCIGRGFTLGEAVLLMGLLSVFVVTWIAHAIEAIIVLLIKKEKGRMWLSNASGVEYASLRKILIGWVLA